MRRHGFSLIELLVVIALILVLLGLMLPALSGARDQARTAICAANQKQLGQALLMYANENQNYAVPRYVDGQDAANPSQWPGLPNYPTYPPNNGAPGWWSDYPLLGQYAGINSLPESFSALLYKRRTTLLCPSDVKLGGTTTYAPSYGLSLKFPWISRTRPNPWSVMWKLYAIPNPSTELVLIDARRERFDPGSPAFYYATLEPNPNTDWLTQGPNNAFNLVKRHNLSTSANALFIDGHVANFANAFISAMRKEIVVSP